MNDNVTYCVIGEWWIEEHSQTAWIYKNDTCYARIPIKKYLREKDLRELLEKFLIIMGCIG